MAVESFLRRIIFAGGKNCVHSTVLFTLYLSRPSSTTSQCNRAEISSISIELSLDTMIGLLVTSREFTDMISKLQSLGITQVLQQTWNRS